MSNLITFLYTPWLKRTLSITGTKKYNCDKLSIYFKGRGKFCSAFQGKQHPKLHVLKRLCTSGPIDHIQCPIAIVLDNSSLIFYARHCISIYICNSKYLLLTTSKTISFQQNLYLWNILDKSCVWQNLQGTVTKHDKMWRWDKTRKLI